MLERVLVAYGVTVLALLMPLPAMGQLPDAPSAVQARQHTEMSFFNEDADLSETRHQMAAGVSIFRWSPGSRWIQPEMANVGGDVPAEQQSFAPPQKTDLGPGLSSSIQDLRPVPGKAPTLQNACPENACAVAEDRMCCGQAPSPFEHYLKRPGTVPLTAGDNLRFAVNAVFNPFNLLTIAADAAIAVGTDSHSPYGPGMKGISKYAGVSFTEDMTGAFFGTFLVPSVTHQDPHYHRQPFMPIRHRILHAFTQVLWARSYSGRPMPNYANLVGGVATAVVSNTFVPGPNRQGFGNTAERLALAFAISPSGNLIAEFLPDVSNRINLRVVIFQRILNRVTFEESGVR